MEGPVPSATMSMDSGREVCLVLGEREVLSYFDWYSWIASAIRSVGVGELAPEQLSRSVCRIRIRLL